MQPLDTGSELLEGSGGDGQTKIWRGIFLYRSNIQDYSSRVISDNSNGRAM